MNYTDFAVIEAQVVSCRHDAVVLDVFENDVLRGTYTVAQSGSITPAPGKYESILVSQSIAARKDIDGETSLVGLLRSVQVGLADRILWNLEADRLLGAGNAGYRIEAEEFKKLSDQLERAIELAKPF